MKKALVIVLAIFLASKTINAQHTDVTNQLTFGGSLGDELQDAVYLTDNSICFGGWSLSGNTGDKITAGRGLNDYWLVRSDEQLDPLWQKAIGGSGADLLGALVPLSDGGVLVAGGSESPVSGDKTAVHKGAYDYWVVKLNSLGEEQWQMSYGGSEDDFLTSAIELENGNILLAGTSSSGVSGDKTDGSRGNADFWLVMTDSDGTLIWDKTYGGSGQDECRSIDVDEDGNVFLCGISGSDISGEKTEDSFGGFDIWVIKTNQNGEVIWDRTLGGSGSEGFWGDVEISLTDNQLLIASTSDSNISGTKSEDSKGLDDFWIIKMDTSNLIIADKTIGGTGQDWSNSIKLLGENILVSGSSASDASGDKTENSKGFFDFWQVLLDQNLNLVWQQSVGGDGFDNLVEVGMSGTGLMLFGTSDSGVSGDKEDENRGQRDYWVVQTSSPLGMEEGSVPDPSVLVYPNPATETLTIKTDRKLKDMELMDALGRRLPMLPSWQGGNGGGRQANISIGHLPTGIYLLRASDGKSTYFQKVVKQ